MKRSAVVLASMLAVPFLVMPTPRTSHAQAGQQTKPRVPIRGFNLFSPAQDIQIGQQSTGTAEKQMALLGVPNADRYINQIVQKLKPFAPVTTYPYAAKIVNGSDLTAFSLPGGPI